MKFSISVYNANKLYAHAKAEQLAKIVGRPQMNLIQCNITDGTLTAQFIAISSCSEFKCRVTDSENGDFWLALPVKKFNKKKDVVVTVLDDDKTTTYTTAQGTQTFNKPAITGNKFKVEQFWEQQPEAKVYINADLLTSALSAYTGQGEVPIKIEFLGLKRGIIIHNKYGEKTLVLPVHADF